MHGRDRDDQPKARLSNQQSTGIVLVIVLVSFFAFLGGRKWDERDYRSEQHYTTAKQNALNTCARAEGPAALQCVVEKIEAAQNDKASADDLNAQQEMAEWAWWMMLFSSLTFIATAIGVWLVKRTLDATLLAVADTGEATKAMLTSNEISSEAVRISQVTSRSLIKLDVRKISPRRSSPTEDAIEIFFEIRNFGQCIAEIIDVSVGFQMGPPGHTFDFGNADLTSLPTNTLIAAGDTITAMCSIAFPFGTNTAISREEMCLYIGTRFEWRDDLGGGATIESPFISMGASFKAGLAAGSIWDAQKQPADT